MSTSKYDMKELVKELSSLSSEAKAKRSEIDQLKSQIKKTKFEYNQKIKTYHSLTDTIINQEHQMEDIQNKISKLQLKQQILISSVSSKCYNHLLDLSNNNSHMHNLFLFFKLCFYDDAKDPADLVRILKNESGIKSMLEYSETIYTNLFKENINKYSLLYNLYQKNINSSSTLNQTFPFDIFFECIGYIFAIIELKAEKKNKDVQVQENIIEKNGIFLNLKSLEGEIQKNEMLYKTIVKYVKGINVLFEKFNSIKSNQNNQEEIDQLMKTIEQIKKVDITNCIMYDNMSSLSVQSEYSYSEIASTKSNNSILNTNISPFANRNIKTNDTSMYSKEKKENCNNTTISKKNSFEIVTNNGKSNSSSNVRHIPKSFQSQKNTVKISLAEKSAESHKKPKEINKPTSTFNKIQHPHFIKDSNENEVDSGVIEIQQNQIVKDSICDEMIASNDDKCNLIKTSSEYISKMNMRNNNYLIKEQKKQKILKLEQSIDGPSWCSSSCSFSCI